MNPREVALELLAAGVGQDADANVSYARPGSCEPGLLSLLGHEGRG